MCTVRIYVADNDLKWTHKKNDVNPKCAQSLLSIYSSRNIDKPPTSISCGKFFTLRFDLARKFIQARNGQHPQTICWQNVNQFNEMFFFTLSLSPDVVVAVARYDVTNTVLKRCRLFLLYKMTHWKTSSDSTKQWKKKSVAIILTIVFVMKMYIYVDWLARTWIERYFEAMHTIFNTFHWEFF